jgi:hypothetical protein
MKTPIVMLSAMLLLANSNFAKTTARKNVPEKVKEAFTAKYQGVNVKKWKTVNGSEEAKFVSGKRKNTAIFLDNGTWVKTETKIPWSKDLPIAVQNAWNNNEYRSWYPDEIKKVEAPDNNVYYTIQVSKDYGPEGSIRGDWEEVYILYFDTNGALLRKEHIRD